MTNSKKSPSSSLLAQAFGVAKKLSSELQKRQVAPTTADQESSNTNQVIEGKAHFQNPFAVEQYESPQQMLRQQFPKLSHQLLGRHYNRVNSIASFVSPDIGEKVSDYLFDRLNQFSSNNSLTEKILEEAGVKDIVELIKDTGRSQRLSQALIEQNKLLAAVEGAVTGATGVWGAAVDIPVSIALVLRTIYQTGRSHGFNLTEQAEQDIVAFIFKEINLGIVAEKQTLLLALKALKSMLETHDLQQFQQLLGSNNDIDLVKQWLVDKNGQFKWSWLNRIPQVSVVGKLTPVAGAVLGGYYSWKLLEDVGHKSQAIFGAARFYLNEHPDENITPLAAYYKAENLLKKASPRLVNTVDTAQIKSSNSADTANDVIKQVEVQKKQAEQPAQNTEQVEAGIQKLADQYVTEHEQSQQKPALADSTQSFTADESETWQSQESLEKTSNDEQADVKAGKKSKKGVSSKQKSATASALKADQSAEQNSNGVITNVEIQAKEEPATPEKIDEKVEAGLQQLADQYVEEHEHGEQQPALKSQPELDFMEEDAVAQHQEALNIEPASSKRS